MTHASKRKLWPWEGRLAACVALAMLSAGCNEISRPGFAGAVPIDPEHAVQSTARVPEQTTASEPNVAPSKAVIPSKEIVSTPSAVDASAVQTVSGKDVPAGTQSEGATPAQAANDAKVVSAVATDAGAAADPASKSPAPGKVEILIKERTFTREKSGELRISYDDLDLLKVLNMEKVTLDAPEKMPEWLKQLNGKQVRIRGFMYPAFQEAGITKFILTRDTGVCCFGPKAKIYDWVQVQMKPGTSTGYIAGRPFDVSGTFRIQVEEFEGEESKVEVGALYHIDGGTVIEK